MRGSALDRRGLAPPQAAAAEVVVGAARAAREAGVGRIVFLDGKPGSGVSHILREIERELTADDEFRVAVGRLPEAPGGHASTAEHWRKRAGDLAVETAAAAIALDPAFALLGPLAGLSIAAARLLEETRPPAVVEPPELISAVIRVAAAEDRSRPLVCLIDDSEWLRGYWWTELQFGFAQEAISDLCVVLVFCSTEGGRAGESSTVDQASALHAARSLVARGMADVASVATIDSTELIEWLGPMPRKLNLAALELSRGEVGNLAELWRGWEQAGVIDLGEDGRWSLREPNGVLGDALGELIRRLERLLPDRDRAGDEAIRQALSCAALEGRTFTARAVADALRADREQTEDLFDLLVDDEDPSRGILLPPVAIAVSDLPRSETQTLWRYGFATPLLWRAARDRVADRAHQADLANRLCDALSSAYGPHLAAVAPALAKLSALSGDEVASRYYRSLVHSPERGVAQSQANLLLAADTGSWSTWDYKDAAEILVEAFETLFEVSSSSDLLGYAERAVEYAQAAGGSDKRALALATRQIGRAHERQGDHEPAIEYLEKARAISSEGDPEALALTLRDLGMLAADVFGDFKLARNLIEGARSQFARMPRAFGLGACEFDLGRVAMSEEDYVEARKRTTRALEIARGELDSELVNGALYQLAEIGLRDDRLDLAREQVEAVLRHTSEHANTYGEASSLRLLGMITVEQGNPREGLKSLEAALALHRRLENADGEVATLHGMAIAYRELGDKAPARELFLKARELYGRLGELDRVAEIEANLDRLY